MRGHVCVSGGAGDCHWYSNYVSDKHYVPEAANAMGLGNPHV